MKKYVPAWFLLLVTVFTTQAQNSYLGDGFGGLPGYKPVNYSVGSDTGFTNCNGTLKGWGSNNYYQLGNGTNTSTTAPVDGLTNVKFYSTGYIMGVIKNDNTFWAWGSSTYYYLSYLPTQIDANVYFIDAGLSHLAYCKNDGTAWVLGQDAVYQTALSGTTPHQVTGISNCVRVAAGGFDIGNYKSFTAFLLNDGTVKYIGGGVLNLTYKGTPTLIPGLTNVVDIKAGVTALYFLKSDGTVWSMGHATTFGLGNSNYTTAQVTPVPVLLPNGVSIKAIAACNDIIKT